MGLETQDGLAAAKTDKKLLATEATEITEDVILSPSAWLNEESLRFNTKAHSHKEKYRSTGGPYNLLSGLQSNSRPLSEKNPKSHTL